VQRRAKLAIIAVTVAVFVVPAGVFLAALSQECTVYRPELINYDGMRSGLALYDLTGWSVYKVSPQDLPTLMAANGTIYCEVYVSDVEALDWNGIRVYVPAQSAVEQLSCIQNAHFYVSQFSPSICMTVHKQALEQIAAVTSVYCIRVIPSIIPVATT
jgi:hypothetical protein